MKQEGTRRDFMRSSVAASAAFGGLMVVGANVVRGQVVKKNLTVGLIGSGGRGSGALAQHLSAAKVLNDKLEIGFKMSVAGIADYFQDRIDRTAGKYSVPKERQFPGPNGYKKLLELQPDIIVTATPPIFRPVHCEASIRAGCHLFMEKPVAVDPPGVRRVVEAGELAKKKGLMIVAGTQRRHEKGYIDTHQALAVEGQYGKLYGGRVAWCSGHAFNRSPVNAQSVDAFVRSWKVWIGLSGDHIVEQHVHNLDVANWFCGRHPVAAAGMGGRAQRPAGNMYDFFSIDLDYGDGLHIHSMCRQISDCWRWVGQEFVYEKGTTSGSSRARKRKDGQVTGIAPKESLVPDDLPQVRGGHSQEHVNMLYYLAKGEIRYNEARNVAEATAVAVMGRTACYTGQLIRWDDMFEDPKKKPELYNLTLKPTAEDFEKGTAFVPKEGVAPIPGKKA